MLLTEEKSRNFKIISVINSSRFDSVVLVSATHTCTLLYVCSPHSSLLLKAIMMAHSFPNATVIASDLSDDALGMNRFVSFRFVILYFLVLHFSVVVDHFVSFCFITVLPIVFFLSPADVAKINIKNYGLQNRVVPVKVC